jgi:hypothetical protein
MTTESPSRNGEVLLREAHKTLTDAVASMAAEMKEQSELGNLWQLGWCKDWNRYQNAKANFDAALAAFLASPVSEKAPSEYVCKCGVRVTPHRCDNEGGF